MATTYSDYEEINGLQTDIMLFIQVWVKEKNLPVPRQQILKAMKERSIPSITAEWAINALLRKRYIRRGYSGTNKTYYVQLRSI